TERKLTQEQVAWSMGMSRVYISEIERGYREPGLGTILKLARSFNISAGELVDAVERELDGK
ncbi:MAG: helix-turn-helix transcriptional regulator, partial [Bacteroidetes bacterium]|nr:helix-turn-helix transcriptional regulator [Bacteroidota bacterium]